MSAYDVTSTQVLGGPSWIDQDRYYIQANASGPAGDAELMAMLQSLLAERFKLVLHRETRLLAGYELVVAKNGTKLKASAPGTSPGTYRSRGLIDAQACTMARLASKLSEVLRVPVSDATKLPGSFDLKLEWTSDDEMSAKIAADSGPSIFTAVQDQLGLRLQSRRIATEVLVVDHAEKPGDN